MQVLNDSATGLRLGLSDYDMKTLFDTMDKGRKGYLTEEDVRSFVNETNPQQRATLDSIQTRLKHILLRMMAPSGPSGRGVTAMQLKETIRSEFSRYDRSRNGRIDASAFAQCLTNLGLFLSPSDTAQCVRHFSIPNTSSVNYEKFLQWLQLPQDVDMEALQQRLKGALTRVS